MRPVEDVLSDLGIGLDLATLYGRYKAKVSLRALDGSSRGKLVLVTGITPTPHGEGKTVVSVGLGMGLGRLGRRAVACIRQPSLGPVFGVKGGGAGGGMATLEPMLDVNLRLTGDIDAITAAHNLLAAAIDNHVFHGNALSIDPSAILWPRVVDVEDRALRQVQVSLAEKSGPPHRGSFIITAASEVMAILCLSRGYADLKARLAKMLVAYDTEGRPVTAGDLKVVGAMAALLKEAMEPNIVQTREGTPAIVHGGPFGNIAHGTCSVVSMLLALQTADYAVVEAGFGSDLGAEKFVDIVVRAAGVSVGTAVVVATVRALRHHGDPGAQGRDVAAVTAGLANLAKHVENVRTLGLRPVVALNIFDGDGEEEVEAIERFCEEEGVPFARTTAFRDGGEGSRRLAEVVMAEAEKGGECAPLYELGDTVRQKVATLVEEMYGGEGVSYTEEGERQLEEVAELGFGGLPVCVAKTSNSLSDDPKLAGRPRGFVVTVHAVEAAAGAGYVIVEMGQISRMPGLPSSPAAERVSLGDDGEVSGVS